MVDIEAIRERRKAAIERLHLLNEREWRVADPLRLSSADVPVLLDEISNLRAALGEERAAHARTQATLNLRTGQLQAARRHADAYEAQVRRLTDQLLTQPEGSDA